MELYLWITLAAAFVYTLATLCMKRSSNAGIGPWRTTVIWNAILAMVAVPYWFRGEIPLAWSNLWPPLLISFGFFTGQLFNCLAVHKGDVSVVTPIMGMKVVFVSILAVFFLTDDTSFTVWAGAILGAFGILLMRGSSPKDKERLLASVILGLLSAFSFAVFDIYVQRYGMNLGFEEMVSRTFTFAFLWSLLLVPLFKSSIHFVSHQTWKWLIAGGILHALQAITMSYVLTTFGNATKVNIVYSSRGFWSITLVWIIGHWFGNYERQQGRSIFLFRLAGSSLLCVAIVLATWN